MVNRVNHLIVHHRTLLSANIKLKQRLNFVIDNAINGGESMRL